MPSVRATILRFAPPLLTLVAQHSEGTLDFGKYLRVDGAQVIGEPRYELHHPPFVFTVELVPGYVLSALRGKSECVVSWD